MKNFEKIKDEDLVFTMIGFEITRKCNMNCIHCAKGSPQNLTITKEIIDKTLDTIKNNEILTLDLFGGEPTLEPDIVEYIADGIIKRNILVYDITLTTNGRIKDIRIFEALNKLGNFLNKNKSKKEIIEWVKKTNTNKKLPLGIVSPCLLMVSTDDHINLKEARGTYQFYKSMENDNVCILWQTDDRNQDPTKEKLYIYMGNAKENYNKLKNIANFRIKDKKGALRKPNNTLIDTPIYICANGNVVNSRMLSYELEDNSEDCICNILTDNLFKEMNEWNFKYPLTHEQRSAKQWCKTEIFNFEHGVKQIYKNHPEYQLTEKVIQEARKKLELFDFVEKTKRICHERLPYLTYDELQTCSDTLLELKLDGHYLNSFLSGYEQSKDYVYDKKELTEALEAYEYLNNSRKPKETNSFWNLLQTFNQIRKEVQRFAK